MSLEAKGSAVSRNKQKRQESSVHTPLHTRRIHVCMHVLYVYMYSMYVLYVCTLCMYSMCVGGGTYARAADAFIPRYLREQGIPPHSIGIADGGVQGVDDAPGPFSLACSPLCRKSCLTWESRQRCILTTFPSFLGDNFVGAMPKSKQNYEYTTQARGSKSTRLEDQMPKRLSQDGCDAGRHTKHCIEQARYPFRCSIVRPSVPVLVFHGSPFRFSTVPPSGIPLVPLRFSTGPPSGFPLVPFAAFHCSPFPAFHWTH